MGAWKCLVGAMLAVACGVALAQQPEGHVRRRALKIETEFPSCQRWARDGSENACWAAFPGDGANVPECALNQPQGQVCKCTNGCRTANAPGDGFRAGYCKVTTSFVENTPGTKWTIRGSYCTEYRTLDQWKAKGLAATETRADETSPGWLGCPSGYSRYSWSSCRLSKRFVGMECWDGTFTGACQTEDGEYKVSCHKTSQESVPTCKAYLLGLESNTCECATFGWWFGAWCEAKDVNGVDPCNGHSCRKPWDSATRYCDYDSGQ